ncbi:hypothetical protein Tco_0738131 [Tanacetum coccineum]
MPRLQTTRGSLVNFYKFSDNSFKVLKLLKNSMEVLKILENNLKSMKLLENKLESMKILENKLESLKLQENRPVDRLFSNGGVIVVKDDPDIIHVENSSDLALTTTLNDLEITALHINGQSIDVDAPPDIIEVDEDDDIIDDEDVLPQDLADSDDEDLVNVDDDDGVVMSADVARGHGGDDGGDDRPPPHESAGGCRGKGTRKPNLRGTKADIMHTRKETRNLGLRKITDELGPQPIRFEWKDNGMMLTLGDHSAHWANLLGEIVREFPMHFGSWCSIPPERKAGVLGKIGPDIRKGIDQHRGKIYTDNKSSLKRDYWVKNPDDETYNVEAIRSRRPANISVEDWDEQIRFWFDPKNMARYAELRDLREEMVRLQGLGTYTDDQIMAMVRWGKQRRHIPDVGRKQQAVQKQIAMITKAMSSDDGYSQLFTQLQSQHESGSSSGCGAGEDDESGDDEDVGEDADS